MKHPPFITLAAIAYAGWMSRSLVITWWTSPLEHYSWLPFIIWLWPIRQWTETLSVRQANGVATAIAVTFLGVVMSINAIVLAGLTIAIASLLTWNIYSIAWAILGISWMPASGWAMVHLFPQADMLVMLTVRIFLALLSIGIMWEKYRANV